MHVFYFVCVSRIFIVYYGHVLKINDQVGAEEHVSLSISLCVLCWAVSLLPISINVD